MSHHLANLPRLLWATTAISSGLLYSQFTVAGPNGENIIAGSATVNRPSTTKTEIIQTSDKAIINWNQFDIGKNEWTAFKQPDSGSITLNRVTGGNPSEILGTLTANGTVMLVNPDGILFGPGAQVDVGGLVATTNDIANNEFMNGRFHFNIPGNPGASIVNEGNITIQDSGIAAFVAPGVRNNGVISARLGSIGLASGNGFTLDMYGDDLIKLKIDDEIAAEVVDVATGQSLSTLIDNHGTLQADGGTVALTAATARRVVDQVINNDGVIEATSIGTRNGKIILGAQTTATKTAQAPDQKVRVAGTINTDGVSSGETGGDVHIIGEMIELQHTNITARGNAGGGTILVGGDYMGGKASSGTMERYGIQLEEVPVPTAKSLLADANTKLDASALETSDGGKIVNWSDGVTSFDGSIRATGGSLSGDGGFVEVSGHEDVLFAELSADLSAPNGEYGTILFDPANFIIDSTSGSNIQALLSTGNNVRVSATGHISIQHSIFSRNNDRDVTLNIEAGHINTTTSLIHKIPDGAGIDFGEGIVIQATGSKKLNVHLDALAGWSSLFTDAYNATAAGKTVSFSQHMNDIQANGFVDCSSSCWDVFQAGKITFADGSGIKTNGGIVTAVDNTGTVIVTTKPVISTNLYEMYEASILRGDTALKAELDQRVLDYFNQKFTVEYAEGEFDYLFSASWSGGGSAPDFTGLTSYYSSVQWHYGRPYVQLPDSNIDTNPRVTPRPTPTPEPSPTSPSDTHDEVKYSPDGRIYTKNEILDNIYDNHIERHDSNTKRDLEIISDIANLASSRFGGKIPNKTGNSIKRKGISFFDFSYFAETFKSKVRNSNIGPQNSSKSFKIFEDNLKGSGQYEKLKEIYGFEN